MAAPFVMAPTCTRLKLPDWNLESRAPNPPIAVIVTVARVLPLSLLSPFENGLADELPTTLAAMIH